MKHLKKFNEASFDRIEEFIKIADKIINYDESELEEEEEFKEVDEDLKESFLIQKNKINEMFNRFNKYN